MAKIYLVVTVFIGVIASLYRLVLGRGSSDISDRGDGNSSSNSSGLSFFDGGADGGGDGGGGDGGGD